MKIKSFFIIATNVDEEFHQPTQSVFHAELDYQEPLLQDQLQKLNENPDADDGFRRCLSELKRRTRNACQDETIAIFLVQDCSAPVLVCSDRGYLES